ncbi:MAG: hypothetical protein ACI4SG_02770 [Oligosphaeraceae bacterium]
MISRFAATFRKGAAWLVFLAATLLLSQGARADWTVELVAGSMVNGTFLEGKYIEGISTQGATQVYLTTDENSCQMLNLLLLRDDTQEWTGITWESAVGGYGNTPVLTSTSIQLYPNAGVGQVLIPANSTRVLLGTVCYNLTKGMDSTPAVKFNKLNAAQSANAGMYTTKVSVTGPGSVAMLKGFNFTVTEGASFTTQEETALTISPLDDAFSCTAWNGTDLVASRAVKFTGVEIYLKDETDARNGDVGINDKGEIVFVPDSNYFGQRTIIFTATSTEGKGEESGSFVVDVTGVDDKPVLDVSSYSLVLTEGMKVKDCSGLSLRFTEMELDREPSLKEIATMVLTPADKDGADISFLVTLTPVVTTDRDPGDYTYSVNFSQVDVVIPYTSVKHPATSKEYTGVLKVTDGGPNAYTAELTGFTAIVRDQDRTPSITGMGSQHFSGMMEPVAGEDRTWLVQADSVFKVVAAAMDDDEEDEVVVSQEFYYQDTPGMTFGQLPALQKGKVVVHVATASSNGLSTSASAYYQVVNKAPALAENEGRIFIRRGGEDTAATGTCTLNVTDVDGATDVIYSVSYQKTSTLPDNLTVTRENNGNVATLTLSYTVPEAYLSSTQDLQALYQLTITNDDADEGEELTYNLVVDFKENPVPVVTIASEASVTISEVDEEGNPVTFTVTAKATDGDVYPAGVKDWEIEVPKGWSYTLREKETATWSTGSYECHATWEVTNNGYDTIANSSDGPRNASDVFTVRIIAVDWATDGKGYADVSVTVNDVDRPPSTPTRLVLSPAQAVHGSTLNVVASGSEDADQDAITYAYLWKYSEDGETFTAVNGEGEAGDSLSLATAIKKGYTVSVAAQAVTAPYGAGKSEVLSDFSESVGWIIGNTAPYFYYIGSDKPSAGDTVPAKPEKPQEFTWEINEDGEAQSIYVGAYDVDVEDGVDSLTYAVQALDASVGVVQIDAATGKLTFTPAKDYFNDGVSMPQVVVSAVDESGAAAEQVPVISLKVISVNDAPVVKAEDQYVLPDQRGEELTATFSVDMGAGESDQELIDARILEVSDPDNIFAVAPSISYGKTSAILTYTVNTDAELGKSATVEFCVKDNGTSGGVEDPKESSAVTITIFVGASPWYPIISFTCASPEEHVFGHTFVLESDEEVLELTVKDDRTQLLPEDYAAVGFEGYPENTDLKVTILVWTMTEGTTEEICAERELSVGEYGLPGRATCAVDRVTADENGWVTLPEIQVPMARSYQMQVVDEDGVTLQSVGPVDFQADKKGMILPTITGQELQIPQAGEFTLLVQGINPAGEGEETPVLTIEVPEATAQELVWGNAPAFAPASGKVLTSETVKFSWPVATNAQEYVLRVNGPDGRLVEEASGLTANNATLELAMDEDPVSYTWYVVAKAGDDAISSSQMQFTLAATTRNPVATGVYKMMDKMVVFTEGVLDDSIQVTFDYQYFSIAEMKWFYGFQTPVEHYLGGLALQLSDDLPLAAGDYVVLLIYVNGEKVGDYVVYLVQKDPSL